jgi:hypothetical protein
MKLQGTTLPSKLTMSMGRDLLLWLKCREEVMRRTLILAMIYLLPAVWFLLPVVSDPDIWWHLQTGKWIVEHGSLPVTDPFSTYGEGKPWVAYSWLFEVGMYGLVRMLGEIGISLYTLVTVWLIMLVLHRIIVKRRTDFLYACIVLAASVIAIARLYTPRPWLLTILFFAITLEVVLSLREGEQPPWMWVLPAIYMLWANVHIQFIYGLGLLGLACLSPVLDRVAQPFCHVQPSMVWGSGTWKKLVIVTALCVCATLLTPHHIRLYAIAVELSAQTGMWEYTQEMQAPTFRSITDWAMLGILAVALIQVGWRRSTASFEILLLLAGGASAFRGQRDVWFLVMGAIVILVQKQIGEGRHRTGGVTRGSLVSIGLIVAVGVLCILAHREISTDRIQQETAKVYPFGAASFVEQQGYPGPLHNHFDWGGYLIWTLPHLKVSMDGRANVHGDERIKRALATWAGGPNWREDPDLKNARVIIAKKDMALTSLLQLDPRVTEVYRDETAVVFVPATAESSQPKPLQSAAEIASLH